MNILLLCFALGVDCTYCVHKEIQYDPYQQRRCPTRFRALFPIADHSNERSLDEVVQQPGCSPNAAQARQGRCGVERIPCVYEEGTCNRALSWGDNIERWPEHRLTGEWALLHTIQERDETLQIV